MMRPRSSYSRARHRPTAAALTLAMTAFAVLSAAGWGSSSAAPQSSDIRASASAAALLEGLEGIADIGDPDGAAAPYGGFTDPVAAALPQSEPSPISRALLLATALSLARAG